MYFSLVMEYSVIIGERKEMGKILTDPKATFFLYYIESKDKNHFRKCAK